MTDILGNILLWIVNIENWKDLATILSGFSTLAIAFLTLFLWRENRALRKSSSEPKLVAYYEPHPDGTGGLNITIANVGTGPAKDVYFQFQGAVEEFTKYDLILDCTRRRGPITMIPQGEKISMLFAIGYQLFKPKGADTKIPMKPFNIRLEWSPLLGRSRHVESFLLDVTPYADLPGFINKPYLLKIADSIDKVGNQIGALSPMVRRVATLIEKTELQDAYVRKVKGNDENIQ